MRYVKFMDLMLEAPEPETTPKTTETSADKVTNELIDPWLYSSSSAIPPMDLSDYDSGGFSSSTTPTTSGATPEVKKELDVPDFLKSQTTPEGEKSPEEKDPDKEFKPDSLASQEDKKPEEESGTESPIEKEEAVEEEATIKAEEEIKKPSAFGKRSTRKQYYYATR